MAQITQLNLLDLVHTVGTQKVENFLSGYTCPLNSDVEGFLRHKALSFALSQTAITYVVVHNNGQRLFILGYFSIINKPVYVDPSRFSRNKRDKLKKFYEYDETNQRYLMAMPLIAQFGKSFDTNLPVVITGSQLMNIALEQVQMIEHLSGGRTVYLECSSEPKLLAFYSQFDFVEFGRRQAKLQNSGEQLVQLIKYFQKPTDEQIQRWMNIDSGSVFCKSPLML